MYPHIEIILKNQKCIDLYKCIYICVFIYISIYISISIYTKEREDCDFDKLILLQEKKNSSFCLSNTASSCVSHQDVQIDFCRNFRVALWYLKGTFII